MIIIFLILTGFDECQEHIPMSLKYTVSYNIQYAMIQTNITIFF